MAIGLIGILMIGFRFFELFVNTVFWYLFNDVVPPEVMGRFVALFRIVGSVAGALFSFFLYGFAGTHASAIFLGVAVLYGTVFLAMCFNVKEGGYPRPSPRQGSGFRLSSVVIFFRECFSHRIFRLAYGYNFLFAAANAINTFLVFHALSVGLGLDAYGKVTGAATFLGVFLIYPMGSLVDRFHPLRIMIAAQAGFLLALASKLIFLAHDFAGHAALWIYGATAALAIPATVANAAAGLPMVMRLFPRERFGQFCSAHAMCGALGTMIGGALAGYFLDILKPHFTAGDFYYRFTPLWSLACTILSFLAMILLYREWKRLGGDASYRPPA